MTIAALIGLVVAAVAALLGGMAGHGIGKSAGKREGAAEATQNQQAEQAKATVTAVQERTNVEAQVSADSDSALNDRLSEFDRQG